MKTDLTQGKKTGFSYMDLRYIGLTDKKYVSKLQHFYTKEIIYRAKIGSWSNFYITKKDAGINVDLKLIEMGKKPVNYLVKK